MGEVINLTDGDRTCDLWTGPNGDSIYHFHKPYCPPEAHIGFSVGPSVSSYNMRLDDGFVFYFSRIEQSRLACSRSCRCLFPIQEAQRFEN
jgi:hypothetical protein